MGTPMECQHVDPASGPQGPVHLWSCALSLPPQPEHPQAPGRSSSAILPRLMSALHSSDRCSYQRPGCPSMPLCPALVR